MDISTANRIKYLKPPPIELIEEFIKELGVSDRQFERFYSIPFSTVHKVRAGERDLPAAYWEIVYKKILPTYGIGFQKILKNSRSAKVSARRTSKIDDHGRLGRLKK